MRSDADDGDRDARQHGLGEQPPLVDELARGDEAILLQPQLRGHLVEGLAEMGEIALRSAHGDLNIEIAGRDLISGRDQATDWRDEAIGEGKSEPGRRQQHDQGDQNEHRREGDLKGAPMRIEAVVKRDESGGLAGKLHRKGIDRPRNVKKRILKGIQRAQGGECPALV